MMVDFSKNAHALRCDGSGRLRFVVPSRRIHVAGGGRGVRRAGVQQSNPRMDNQGTKPERIVTTILEVFLFSSNAVESARRKCRPRRWRQCSTRDEVFECDSRRATLASLEMGRLS